MEVGISQFCTRAPQLHVGPAAVKGGQGCVERVRAAGAQTAMRMRGGSSRPAEVLVGSLDSSNPRWALGGSDLQAHKQARHVWMEQAPSWSSAGWLP